MKPMKRRDTLKAALGGLLLPTAMPGRGIDTGDYLFNGGTVWLDHGAGLLTMVCHLSRIDVQVGDRLAAGQPYCAVGATGPHLHWLGCANAALAANSAKAAATVLSMALSPASQRGRRPKQSGAPRLPATLAPA